MSPIRTGRGEGQLTLDASLAGMCARRRTYFLLRRQKKVGKEKATPLTVSLRCASGNLRCSGLGRCCGTHCAPCGRSVQTTAASQSTLHGHAALPMPAPGPALLGTARGALKSTRAIAALGPWDPHPTPPFEPGAGSLPQAGEAMRGWAERSDGLYVYIPLWLRLRREACGVARAAQHARASWSDSRGMSERSAQRAASSTAHPASLAPQVCLRSAAKEVADLGALSFAYFSCAYKKSRCAAGRISRPRRLVLPHSDRSAMARAQWRADTSRPELEP